MSTKTRQHMWVKHTITPVSVIVLDGHYTVYVDPDIQEDSEMNAVYGCDVCNNPLITHFNTECEGSEE